MNIKYIYKGLKILAVIYIVVSAMFFFLIIRDQMVVEYHYSEQGKCITIWKRLGGRCYVIPYKYTPEWFKVPEVNFLRTESLSNLAIYWTSDTTVYIDNSYYTQDLNKVYCFNEEYDVYNLEPTYGLKTQPINWSKIADFTLDTLNTTAPDYSIHVSINNIKLKEGVDKLDRFFIAGGFNN